MAERPSVVCIRGGSVVGSGKTPKALDVLITGDVITAIEASIAPPKGATVLDASGCLVGPGLVDLHTHLREPGGERAETVESGARAGALGGYTALLAMPNTTPAIDSAAVVRDVRDLARHAIAEVAVSGAITAGRAGESLAAIGEMAAIGVHVFTDDGTGVQDGALMRRALEYARDLGVLLAQHCEDAQIAAGGHMHEGTWSSKLGIPGQSSLAEEAMLLRDLGLVRLTGAPMHFLHMSTSGSIAHLRDAKAAGLPITAEATPHHLSLTDAEVASFDAVFKVNPPLREEADIRAVRAGVIDKTIDAIATDHAPHETERKEESFEDAPPGMIGLETALAISYDVLCRSDDKTDLSPQELFKRMSCTPARIAALDRTGQGVMPKVGSIANLCIFDPTATWTVVPALGASKSRNSPFAGRGLTGRVRHTIFRGEAVVIDAEPQR